MKFTTKAIIACLLALSGAAQAETIEGVLDRGVLRVGTQQFYAVGDARKRRRVYRL